MKQDNASHERPQAAQPSREVQRAPAPGKVTRTSKLSGGREPAVQRKAATAGAAWSSPARSSADLAGDVHMDMAHRGLTALAERAPVQARGAIDGDPAAVHDAASAGVSGAGGSLPHAAQIQASFGQAHDISGVRAHVGGAAQEASQSIGAQAYATGNHVAFRGQPDLHTAAHEAAHVVQQRAGVQLSGGVGQAGDTYERHADAVADRVVQGRSAEDLLSGMGAGVAAGAAIQRREVANAAAITFPGDWVAADRHTLSGTFETANLHNLSTGDTSQYVQIEERRDFYRWFYQYTAARGYTTRWALAASLVANGAHQVAHMDPVVEGAARLVGTVSDELQGMMRIGNQVIFDNVFPKLQQLLAGGPLTGAAALRWDMQVLSEEQSLIQPLYASVSPSTISQLEGIARQQGFAGLGAWITGGANVPAGPHNNGGSMPGFGGGSILSVDDRWTYGMQVGNQFTPGGTGYDPARHSRPAAGSGYTSGAELNAVNVRPNLHMLDAVLDSPADSDPARILSLLRALTPHEQGELLADRSPDGTQYSDRLGECSFDTVALTGMIMEVTSLTTNIPAIVGGYTGGAAHRSTFLSRYNTKVTSLRGIARSTQMLPPMPMGRFGGF
jgi:hypothetical protein